MSRKFQLVGEFWYLHAFRGGELVGTLYPPEPDDILAPYYDWRATIGTGLRPVEKVPTTYDRKRDDIQCKDGSTRYAAYTKKFDNRTDAERWLRDNT